jgi:pimeloyl-ACP methyl ester carboxylesterase
MKQWSNMMIEFGGRRIGTAFASCAIAASCLFFLCFQTMAQGDNKPVLKTAIPSKSSYAMINGIRIHYLEWGSKGPALILLHGMNDDAQIWKKMGPLLASGYHVIAPDRRGAGDSDKPKDGYDYKTLVNDVALLARSLKLKRVTVVGHSFGAEIALNMAVQEPELVRSVVLVDGGFWPKRQAGSETPSSPIELTSRDYDPEALYPDVTVPILLIVARGSGPGAEVLAELKKQGIDFFEEVKKAELGVKELADRKLRHAQIKFIGNTSHWIQKDQPQLLAQTIEQFLAF